MTLNELIVKATALRDACADGGELPVWYCFPPDADPEAPVELNGLSVSMVFYEDAPEDQPDGEQCVMLGWLPEQPHA